MRKILNKKILISAFILLIGVLIITFFFSNNKNSAIALDTVSLKETISNNNSMFAIMVENEDGEYEEYTDGIEWPTGMVFNAELSGCIDAEGNKIEDSISFSGGIATANVGVTSYCYLYFYHGWCIENGITNLAECILQSENESDTVDDAITYIKSKGTPSFSSTSTTDDGLYYAEDDYGDSYYFRGAVTDNYVYFAGFYWRIIRVNGDGSIRMIYDGTEAHDNGVSSTDRYISTSAFNSLYSDNAYVGYMYGTVEYEESVTSTTQTLQSYYYYYASTYTFDTNTGYYTLGDDASQQVWNSGLVGYYTCASTSTTCTTMYYIYSYSGIIQGRYTPYTSTSSTDGDVTTYTESHGTSSLVTLATWYYYGTGYSYDSSTGYYTLTGYALNVYDGTGSVTDLTGYYTCGSTSYSNCSTLYYITSAYSATVANVTKYIISSTQTYETTHTNTTSSKIKSVVDSWYLTNIYNVSDGTNSYDDYISDTLFCNDRSVYSGTGVGSTMTYYGAYKRLITNKSPVLTCPQQNDAFTVSDTTNGNGDLTYKVGLITADEVAMAGGKNGTNNSSYYLYIGSSLGLSYWTMTPVQFGGVYAVNFRVDFSNGLSIAGMSGMFDLIGFTGVTYSFGVRPVINLSSSIILTSGNGSIDSPYTVALE